MSVSPTNWLSNSLKAIEDVLVNSANVRALLGTTGDSDPWPLTRALILWQDTRGQGQAAPCIILVIQPGDHSESEALKVTRHIDSVEAYFVWPVNNTGGSSDKDYATIALNLFGAIMADIAATLGTPNPDVAGASFLTKATRHYEPPSRTPDDSARPNCWDALILFSWEI